MSEHAVVPRVSVVIPVKNRAALLGKALDGLDRQLFRDFEVIVVDDGSTDASPDVAIRDVAGREVRVLSSGGVGAVAARRIGVAASRAELLAFTDSDCVPSPVWLAHAVAGIDDGADVVNGRTQPASDPQPLERTMGSGTEGLYPTCNMVYRRSVYDEAGGFDGQAAQRLGFRPDARSRGDGFGEDTMLAWRVARAGRAVKYVPDALVFHHVFTRDLKETLSRTIRMAAFPALIREVPELEQTLMRYGVQLGERTRLPFYAFVVAVAAGKKSAAVASAVGWAGLRAWELRGAAGGASEVAALVPAEMAVDALTGAALVVGSVKARRVVL